MSRLALTRYLTVLNYALIPIPNDPDPVRTRGHIGLIALVVNGGDDLSALGPSMKNLATDAQFETRRKQIKALMAVSDTYRFVRRVNIGSEMEDFLYRQTNPDGDKYWNLRFNKGLLVRLTVENQ